MEKAKLAAALEASGFKSVAQARDSGLRRRQAEEHGRDAQAAFKGVAPEGIEVLREQIASLPEPEEERDDFPTVEEAKEAETDVKAALTAASEQQEGCRAELADARTKAARAAAAVENAEGRRVRAVGQIAGLEDPEAARSGLSKEVRELSFGLTEAARQREEIAAMAPDLDAAQATLERAQVNRGSGRDGQVNAFVSLSASWTRRSTFLAGEAVEEELSDIIMRVDDAKTGA